MIKYLMDRLQALELIPNILQFMTKPRKMVPFSFIQCPHTQKFKKKQ